jgi:hypothetical protein
MHEFLTELFKLSIIQTRTCKKFQKFSHGEDPSQKSSTTPNEKQNKRLVKKWIGSKGCEMTFKHGFSALRETNTVATGNHGNHGNHCYGKMLRIRVSPVHEL